MTAQMRNDFTPQEYIRHMFAETENGRVAIGYKNPHNCFVEEEKVLELNWTADDAKMIEQRYNALTFALTRIGQLHDELKDERSRIKLLSESDLAVWNTYVRPYEDFEVDMSVIEYIRERAIGDLSEEEEALWKRYCMWREEQSQKRIPFNRRSCADMITRAARYEKLISLNAPEIVVNEEGRCLAEEMVLYYFGKEESIVWD